MKLVAGLCLTLLFLGFSNTARALPIVNPAPEALAEDIDGSGYFEPVGNIFGIEIFDVGEFLALPGSTFGFFFQGSDTTVAANLITIFDSDDFVNSEAVVNFGSGIVVDVDEAIVQSIFSGSGNIGFFLTLNAFGGGTLFSDPLLNDGADYFGALPFLVDPGRFALVFANPADQSLIGLSVINGAVPATSVPEPTAMSLLSIGLLGIFGLRSRRRLIS